MGTSTNHFAHNFLGEESFNNDSPLLLAEEKPGDGSYQSLGFFRKFGGRLSATLAGMLLLAQIACTKSLEQIIAPKNYCEAGCNGANVVLTFENPHTMIVERSNGDSNSKRFFIRLIVNGKMADRVLYKNGPICAGTHDGSIPFGFNTVVSPGTVDFNTFDLDSLTIDGVLLQPGDHVVVSPTTQNEYDGGNECTAISKNPAIIPQAVDSNEDHP